IAGGQVVKINQRAAIIGIGLFAFAKDSARKAAAEHTVRGHGAGHHAGASFGALDGVAEKLLPVIRVITQSAEAEIHLQEVLRLESGIELLLVLHAATNQAEAA